MVKKKLQCSKFLSNPLKIIKKSRCNIPGEIKLSSIGDQQMEM